MMGRVFADLNSRTFDDRGEKILVGKEGSWQIERYHPLKWLTPGATVMLYDGELEVKATLEFDEQQAVWYGRPDWSTRRDLESAADGLEGYRESDPDQRLLILRNEMALRIGSLQGYADLLKRTETKGVEGLPEHYDRLVDDLAKTADDLKRILDALTG